ncbi:MAG TPA: hypothetical protein VHK69_03655 [Chitinophagaceae bacterium]|jgi:hypothetical protein|nr:hypothetical protein [Chitinophagaceae bacterium]
MKQWIPALLACLFTAGARAQSVNGVPLKDLDMEYIDMTVDVRPLTTKLRLVLDIGQETKLLDGNRYGRVKDGKGEELLFHSRIDALNFMDRFGYELHLAYAVTESNSTEHHYILRRKKAGRNPAP